MLWFKIHGFDENCWQIFKWVVFVMMKSVRIFGGNQDYRLMGREILKDEEEFKEWLTSFEIK